MDRTQVEATIQAKINEFQAKMELEEVTKKAVKLKVRRPFESDEERKEARSEPRVDLNLEVLRELREMKGSLRDGLGELRSVVGDMSQVIREFSGEVRNMEHKIGNKLDKKLTDMERN